jgi:cytoskeletal protein RodZ
VSVLHPVGPLPPRVYWVRRLLVLAAALVVLLVAAWAWGAVTGDEGGDGAEPGGTQSSPPATSQSPEPTPSDSGSPSPSPSTSKSPSGTPACADDDIQVVATPSKTSYAEDQDPRFTVKVTNTSKSACKRDVGQKAMEVRVSKGDTAVWSSDHCNPGGDPDVVTLKAGESYTTSVIWSRTTSKAGCPDGQPDAAPGTYALTGRNLKVLSEPVAFALT